MVDERVAVGLIGAGRIGTSHAQVIAERVPGARLLAVCDPRLEAAQTLAARFDARVATDPTELITDPDVAAVHETLAWTDLGTPPRQPPPRCTVRDRGRDHVPRALRRAAS